MSRALLPLAVAGALALAGAASSASERRAAARAAAPPAHPIRIVSTSLPSDEILLALVAPERVLAVSAFAADPEISSVALPAARLPRVTSRPESVLALEPDLVLAFPFARPEASALLGRLAVPVVPVAHATTLDAVRANVLAIGRVVSALDRAEALIDGLDRRVERAAARAARRPIRPRVVFLTSGGYTAGPGSLLDALLELAGGDNAVREVGLAATAPLSLELLLSLDPDALFVVEYRADRRAETPLVPSETSLDPRLAPLRAKRFGHVYRLPPRLALSTSHHVADLLPLLGDLLDRVANDLAGGGGSTDGGSTDGGPARRRPHPRSHGDSRPRPHAAPPRVDGAPA